MSVLEMAAAGAHPTAWDDYVGQEGAKRMLRVALLSAKRRGDRLEHTLIAHPDAGIGKTSLALLTAMEREVNIEVVSGKMSFDQIRVRLAMMDNGDILLLEEVHRMFQGGKAAGEWLLHLMQNDVLLGPLGPERVPKVTLMGTTTDVGALPEPILQRFIYKPDLRSYSDDEGALIALKLARKVFPQDAPLPSTIVAFAIARAAANKPRTMRDILCHLRDLVTVGELDPDPDYDLSLALHWTGLTEDGLTRLAQDYMTTLFAADGRAGIKSIAEQLGQLVPALNETERLLLSRGYVERTSQGRRLTADGIRRAKQLATAA